ncbi:MAG: hypothetical protein GY715_05625 [Planctomycetes bacterium]|nr:hypothetical protein [Planctomycetota bacterium]
MSNGLRFGWAAVAALGMSLGAAHDASGQYEAPDVFDVTVSVDSGFVTNSSEERDVVYSTVVQAKGVAWMRVLFDEALLAAAPAGGRPTVIRITSLLDGAVQHLDSVRLAQWRNATAYFNGNSLLVELIADPGSGASRIRSTTARIGPEVPAQEETICFGVDDRVLSFDDRAGRIMPVECTAWLIDDANRCFLTAGHCTFSVDTMQFNVPLSSSGGQVQHPGPDDQYPIDPVSMQTNGGGGIGNDWAYFGCFENSETGLTPAEAQGDWYVLAGAAPPDIGQDIRITGYGSTSSPVSPTWNKVQKTHSGPYEGSPGTQVDYQTDTTGGNSGSPVIDESTGHAIGIHTHGGCGSGGGSNHGTAIENSGLQSALANPQGVCIPLPSLTFSYPAGLPDELGPDGGGFLVQIDGQAGAQLQPGTGQLHYDDGQGFVAVPLIQQVGNVYQATFPALPCDVTVDYYVSAETTDAALITDPSNAPTGSFSAPVVCPGIVGDVTGDGVVNFADILAVIGAWGDCPDPPALCPADANEDTTVNFADILLIIANWTQ